MCPILTNIRVSQHFGCVSDGVSRGVGFSQILSDFWRLERCDVSCERDILMASELCFELKSKVICDGFLSVWDRFRLIFEAWRGDMRFVIFDRKRVIF